MTVDKEMERRGGRGGWMRTIDEMERDERKMRRWDDDVGGCGQGQAGALVQRSYSGVVVGGACWKITM